MVDNKDGTYNVRTKPGYIFLITLIPNKEKPKDIVIEYIGKEGNLPVVIKEIKVTGKSSNSIAVNVTVERLDGGKLSYYYKKENETEYHELTGKQDTEDLTAEFIGLEQNQIYNIKVVAKNEKSSRQKTINVLTGELERGEIRQKGETKWTNGKASIELEKTNPNLILKYQINTIEGTWLTYDEKIENLTHEDTVYAILTDGINIGYETRITVKDNTPPTVTVTKEEVTTNSIRVTVTSTDEQWGMDTNPTYSYFIKKATETDYQILEDGINIGTGENFEASYIFTDLKQNTDYDIKVITKDKAQNEGVGILLNTKTGTVGAANPNLETGNIIASSPKWDKATHTASITLITTTSMRIQYQKNGIEGEWITTLSGQNSVTISGLNHNDIIYARLYDGTNAGDEASVTIKDGQTPNEAIIGMSQSSIYIGTKVVGMVEQTDDQSGVDLNNCKWIFTTTDVQLNEDSTEWEKATTFSSKDTPEFTPESNGNYYLHVLTVDKAGNKKVSKSEVITVKMQAATIELNSVRARIATGHTRWLNAVATPSEASQRMEWISSNTAVATVDSEGKITAIRPGKATITVKTKDETNLSQTCEVTVENAEDVTTVTSIKEENRVAKDSDGNLITVPGGFEVVTGEKATEGIVIQDKDGNQYVWVPVDSVSKGANQKAVDIRLGRYDDFTTQTVTENYIPKQYAENYEQSVGIVTWGGNTYEDQDASNGGAGNLKDFVEKTIANGGYYIARYEASVATEYEGDKSKNGAKALSIPGKVPPNVAYDIALEICRATFADSSTVKSDLVNSYAWDTALVFIQKCSENKEYANKNSVNASNAKTGEAGDEACHIHDMASNYYEWSTEVCPSGVNGNGVYRGGYFGDTNWSPASVRGFHQRGADFALSTAQRQILYLTNESLAGGTLTALEPTWDKTSHKASITLNTSTSLLIQYQINSITTYGWKPVPGAEKSVTISNLNHNDTIYARVWDGINVGLETAITVKDGQAPNKADIKIAQTAETGKEVTGTITQTDDQSGVDLNNSKWIFSKISTVLSEESTVWNSATTFRKTPVAPNSTGTYYLHVLTVDKAGNKTASVSEAITIKIGGATEGLASGVITASTPSWNASSHTASVNLSTTTGLTIQWQKNSIAENGWTTSNLATGLNHGDTLYARLTDGTNAGKEASVSIMDGTNPQTATISGLTTTMLPGQTITVTVTHTDNQSGINLNNCKWIFNTISGYLGTTNSAWNTATSFGTKNSISITPNTVGRYYLHVLSVDNAGNKREVNSNVVTVEVPKATEGLASGVITASTPSWNASSHTASVTLSTTTGLTIQWQKNSIAENGWTTSNLATGLNHGDTLYARLTDGTNAGKEASVSIIDGINPEPATISGLTTVMIAGKTITATVTHTDNQSGINLNNSKWIFNTTSGNLGTTNSAWNTATSFETKNSISITVPNTGGTYYLHVLSVDQAGNKRESISKAITVKVADATAGLASGVITASTPSWNVSSHTASLTLSTTTGLTIQWQKNSIAESGWTTSNSATGLNHGDTLYARLTNGINAGKEASVSIIDGTRPELAEISGLGRLLITGQTVTVTVTHTDNESGIKLANCKWIFTTSGYLVTNDSEWNTATSFGTKNSISVTAPNTVGTYYLHVLSEDIAGNKTVSKSESVTVGEPDSDWEYLERVAKHIATRTDITINSNTQNVRGRTERNEEYNITVGDTFKVRYNNEAMLKTVRVLGFKHDELASGEGYGNGTTAKYAGISFEFVDFIGGYLPMNSKNNTHPYGTNEGGWAATEVREILNGQDINYLNNASEIKKVKKEYIETAKNKVTSLPKTEDYLWLLSCAEIWSDGYTPGTSGDAVQKEGSQYKYYKNIRVESYREYNDAMKKPNTDSAKNWWLRSPAWSSLNDFCLVRDNGRGDVAWASSWETYMAPGFCI